MKLAALSFSVLAMGMVACGGSDGAPIGSPDLEGPDVAESSADLTSGRVSIRIPLIDQEKKPLSRHNAKLAAAGLGSFPETVEIEGRADGQFIPGTDDAWHDAAKLEGDAFDAIELEVQMQMFAEPHDFRTSNPETTLCYKGNPRLVVPLIQSLTDSVFSDQLNVHGWRFRQTKVLDDSITPKDEATLPSVWKNWRGRGNAILMLTASSDDGSETNVAIIPRCSP